MRAARVTLPVVAGPALHLNVVDVVERAPAPDAAPISWRVWRLLTTEPIATAQDVARIVAIDRRRWLIAEFF